MGSEWYSWGDGTCNKVEYKSHHKDQEKSMISITEAIVNKGTMMVKFLNATIAEHAMECSTWFYNFAVEAKVLQINTLFICYPKKFL